MDIPTMARLLIGGGMLLIVVGGMLWVSSTLIDWGIDWGNLPGDFAFRSGSTRVYLPLGTMIVASIILTLLLNLFLRMLR